jgi:hypothetical protein
MPCAKVNRGVEPGSHEINPTVIGGDFQDASGYVAPEPSLFEPRAHATSATARSAKLDASTDAKRADRGAITKGQS